MTEFTEIKPAPKGEELRLRRMRLGAAGGRKRTKFERDIDFVDEARLYLNGYSLGEISQWISENRDYTLTTGTAGNDMRKIRDIWRDRYLKDYDTIKAQELANIDVLEKAAWDAWNKSMGQIKEGEKSKVADNWSGTKTGATGYTRESSRASVKEGLGDPRYLTQIERCIKMRISIFGLDAPRTVNVNWRQEALDAGVNPDNYVNGLAEDFFRAAVEGDSGKRSLGEGPSEA